jgi:chromosome segregation ATPase
MKENELRKFELTLNDNKKRLAALDEQNLRDKYRETDTQLKNILSQSERYKTNLEKIQNALIQIKERQNVLYDETHSLKAELNKLEIQLTEKQSQLETITTRESA